MCKCKASNVREGQDELTYLTIPLFNIPTLHIFFVVNTQNYSAADFFKKVVLTISTSTVHGCISG